MSERDMKNVIEKTKIAASMQKTVILCHRNGLLYSMLLLLGPVTMYWSILDTVSAQFTLFRALCFVVVHIMFFGLVPAILVPSNIKYKKIMNIISLISVVLLASSLGLLFIYNSIILMLAISAIGVYILMLSVVLIKFQNWRQSKQELKAITN